jgi:very-short-patch-repair endonuclease
MWIARARQLRQQATDAEAFLWSVLRARQVNGRKFRRQHPLAPYILDSFCAELSLCIELDGGQHFEPEGLLQDARRDAFLLGRGIRTLRFTNEALFRDTDAVLNFIWDETR